MVSLARLPFPRFLLAFIAFSKIYVTSFIVSKFRADYHNVRSMRPYLLKQCSSHVNTKTSVTLKASSMGAGVYQEVPLKDLLSDVLDKPVLIKRPEKLRNKYFGLRHGESMANIANIISSDPVRGSQMHGLTITGKIQARRAAGLLIEEVKRENLKNLVILSSNFTRARETATETLQVTMYVRVAK